MKVFILLLVQIFSSSTNANFSYPNCESAGTSCLDCYTQKYCLDFFGLVHWSSTNCASTSANTPYCDPTSNTCTNILPSECTALSSYNCLRDGVFPDLTDCSSYYHCTNNTSEEITCPVNYVYKQEWGKCVYQLRDADCVKIPQCTYVDSIATYPGDASLYHQCKAGALSLSACEETQQFNSATRTCENICESSVDGTTLPNTRNCRSYYVCENSSAVVKSCDLGYGLNFNTERCEWGYQNLCNELVLLDDDISGAALLIPVYGVFWLPLRTVFRALNFNPFTLILAAGGVSDNTASTGILIGDYAYKNMALPTSIVSVVINIAMPYLPAQIRTIIQTLMQLGLLNGMVRGGINNWLPSGNVIVETPQLLLGSLETLKRKSSEKLGNAFGSLPWGAAIGGVTRKKSEVNETIDVSIRRKRSTIAPRDISFAGLQGKAPSQVIVEILRQFFQISDAQLPLALNLIKFQLPVLSKELNGRVGLPLFKVEGGKSLKVDVAVVDAAFYKILGEVAQIMYPDKRFLAEMFKAFAKQLYLSHRDVVVDVADALELSFEKVA